MLEIVTEAVKPEATTDMPAVSVAIEDKIILFSG
jgi:hypothetical protein